MKKIQKISPAALHRPKVSPVAAACATMLALSMPFAQAQQATDGKSGDLSTVVVTGIRSSLDTSTELKRSGRGVVDGIVAEDIGKFPDTNLAESMQRVAGVSIDRNPSGEGSKVTVRGVGPDYNMVLLNGRQMPTSVISNENGGANGSRAFDFANLSTDSISAIEVYKTSRAENPTGGIGATINIKTARPLDLKQRVAAFSVKGNSDESNSRLPSAFQGKNITPELSGIYSDTFADGTIGIAISGNYSKRDSGSNKAYTQGGWRVHPGGADGDWGAIPAKPAAGVDPITNRPAGVYTAPVDLRYSLTSLERERLNGQATLQFAPSKDLKFTLDYTMADNTTNKKNAELSSWFNFSYGPTTFTTQSVPSPLEMTSLFPGDHDLAINTGMYGEKTQNRSTGFNADWKVSKDLSVEFDAHHSTSTTAPNSPFGTYSVMDLGMFAQGNAIAYYGQKFPILSLPTTTFSAAAMQMTGSQFNSNLSDQTVDQAQLRATYKLDPDNTLNTGLGFTKVQNRSASYNNQNNDWGGVGAKGDYANVKYNNSSSIGGYFGQIPGSGDSRLFPQFIMADFNSLREQFITVLMTKGVGGGAPMTRAQAEAYSSAAADYTKGNDWRTTEKSTSAYVQWDHAIEASIPMNVSLGLRYERTDVESASQVVPITATSWDSQNEINYTRGAPTFGTGVGSYTYVLPSIDWDADLTKDVKVRASYGENIGRPGWNALQGGVNINGSNANAGGGGGGTGNPALKPLKSKSFDLSAEYYYAKSSYVAAGAFFKTLTDAVGNSNVSMTVPGVTTPIGGAYYKAAQAACGANAQPLCLRNYIFANFNGQPGVTVTGVNGAETLGKIAGLPGDPQMNFAVNSFANQEGDTVRGLELTAQHVFGTSGFGVAGNYTWVKPGQTFDDTSIAPQSVLLGISNSYNLVGFYEDNAWSVRAAYNWRGQFLFSKADGGPDNNPVYTEPYGQVDVSIGYKIGKNLTMQADLINLNDGYIRQHGRSEEQLVSVTQTGRRYQFGLRYKF